MGKVFLSMIPKAFWSYKGGESNGYIKIETKSKKYRVQKKFTNLNDNK